MEELLQYYKKKQVSSKKDACMQASLTVAVGIANIL